MGKNVAIGIQDFEELIQGNYFYIDKTMLIKEWWESGDSTTLITRPRRFGKTLNMSMLEQFFSVEYANRGDLFEGLAIWEEEKYRALQGTFPVISLSFARVKDTNLADAKERLGELIGEAFKKKDFLLEGDVLTQEEKEYYRRILANKASAVEVTSALHRLSDFLCRHYGKRVIILLDEYDTPMQEAYIGGYWGELVSFTRNLFNSTFKTNPYLHRAVMTGITRVSKESIFSDLNHLKVVTTTSEEYATLFGFTEGEVFGALEYFGYAEERADVKTWYDGFVFGSHRDIYNPWSILNFLDTGKLDAYWANSSSNDLVCKLLQEGGSDIKEGFEVLLKGEVLKAPIDEQIVYNDLESDDAAVWSLLLAAGYLKALSCQSEKALIPGEHRTYELQLTNLETEHAFKLMVRGWFKSVKREYNGFIESLLSGDVEMMNLYMNRVTRDCFSFFDTGRWSEPERFYHGFVLGLLVELQSEYTVTSNRESGFGRYDIMLEPKNPQERDAIILEFKVLRPGKESSLEDTVAAALKQIEEKQYSAQLISRGIPADRIRSYGFAFEGKQVLIG